MHLVSYLWMGPVRVGEAVPSQLSFELTGRAQWVELARKQRGTQFLRIPSRQILNTSAATKMPFWSLNPYIGCEFGCSYCYARDTHRYTIERGVIDGAIPSPHGVRPAQLPPWLAFERHILVKAEAPRRLAQSLDPQRLRGEPLVIGTATDPYQPAEREFGITRRILEVLLGFREMQIGIITKSPLITRDLDLLQPLAGLHKVTIHISLATTDPQLARRLEPRSPIPARRLAALAALREAGIRAGLLVAPILPEITDGWTSLAQLMAEARAHGACFVGGDSLRLGPAARTRFFQTLRAEFPELLPRYEHHFAHRHAASRAYRRALGRRLTLLRETYGFPTGGRGLDAIG